MNEGKKDRDGLPSKDQRTVFVPRQGEPELPTPGADSRERGPTSKFKGGSDPLAAGSDAEQRSGVSEGEWSVETPPKAEESGRTTINPERRQPGADASGLNPKGAPPLPSLPAENNASQARSPPMELRHSAQGIKVGDILNHTYEVKRFIARGGMGEVFEGCNVNVDERVAIKVILPSLAADPNVISMFLREARSLTRLQHEALVQYRLLTREPQLDVLYIVTEYIDGVPLSEVFGSLRPFTAELESLLRRLASGLGVAHGFDVLHRDMSPDNVLLEGGRLAAAKIIDFGIAKDLDPGSATIIGDGFAGKLNYVAPEQLGAFGREMGPWTDVYSLGLVILSVAMGRDVQMGGTLADAVDKRRAGVDVSAAPERLRPVLERMLRPNPAERFRTMDEVLRALDEHGERPAAPPAGGANGTGGRRLPMPALVGGAATLALVLVGGIWLLSPSAEEVTVDRLPGGGGIRGAQGNLVEVARQAIDSEIPSVNCSWLEIADLRNEQGQVTVRMAGVAGSPSAAQNNIARALTTAGAPNPNIDVSLVAPISPAGCAAIDTYRQFRNMEAPRLSSEQRVWEMQLQKDGPYQGNEAVRVVGRMSVGDPKLELTLFGIDSAGLLHPMIERVNGREVTYFDKENGGYEVVAGWHPEGITPTGNDSYKFTLGWDTEGWQGLVLITGKGPFSPNLVRPPPGARPIAWSEKFWKTASRQGWRVDMTWAKVENRTPGD